MVIQLLRVAGRIGVGLALLLPLQVWGGAAASPGRPLSFRAMEGDMPADPLLASSDPMGKPHATPSPWLDDARSQLALAVPRGMSTPVALEHVRAAGAHCRQTDPGTLSCRYHGVETRDDYVDDVRWQIDVAIDQDRVQGITLARTWTRH